MMRNVAILGRSRARPQVTSRNEVYRAAFTVCCKAVPATGARSGFGGMASFSSNEVLDARQARIYEPGGNRIASITVFDRHHPAKASPPLETRLWRPVR